VRVGLVQINAQVAWSQPNEASGRELLWAGALPYSIGLLQAYAVRHAADRHEFVPPVFTRVAVAEAVERLEGCDLVGFSSYVWNARLSLRIAEELKRAQPETRIVFGGPHVPDRAESWLRAHPFVDVAVHGEGERTFTAILDGAEPDGASWLRGGEFHHRPKAPRIADMSTIPSPYLDGTFAPLLEAHPGERWVMMWETNRGCPFSCSFCDWGSATQSKVFRFEDERLHAEIDWMGRNGIGFVWVCDANYGMLRRDYELVEALAASRERTGLPISLCVQNTKNATDRAYRIQKLLSESFHTQKVTLSMQSVNPGTLENIRRSNISSDSYRELQQRFARDGIYTYTDLILGLPGETYDDFADGISQVVADGQHNQLVIYNCSVLPNAELGDPAYLERFGLETVPQIMRDAFDPADRVNEVEEYIETVVATAAMPSEDWVRARVFAWLADLFYFDRLLQLPLALLVTRHGLPLRRLVEHLARSERPVLAGLNVLLTEHARAVIVGANQFVPAPDWANLCWPADQYALATLVVAGKIDAFYSEVEAELEELLDDLGLRDTLPMVHDALELNRAMLRLPFETGTLRLALSHNVLEAYRGSLVGDDVPVREGLFVYSVERTHWSGASLGAWFNHLAWCDSTTKYDYLHDARAQSFAATAVG
jgi:2-(S-pantetheinyl)-carbapenam-3-carboxylate methyltransferase